MIKNDAMITIRTNSDVKERAQDVYAQLGVDISTAINVFLRQSVSHHGFPFQVNLEVPNDTTRQALDDATAHRNLSKPYASVDALMEDLDAEYSQN